MLGRFRLISPVLAIFPVDDHHESASVPIGTVVEQDGKTFNGNRLMDVLWNGRKVMMFTNELRDKSVPA